MKTTFGHLGGQGPRPLADPALGPGSFRRIVDVPFETCVAALDSWQRTAQGGEARFGGSLLCGPVERDPGSATCQIRVRLARGVLRPLLRMRLDIDRWSSSSSAVELIPGGRVRPAAAYFRAGHRLLDSLTGHLLQLLPAAQARDAASQPLVPPVPGVLNPAARHGHAGPDHQKDPGRARSMTGGGQ